jgi:hypothetical protein
MDNIEFDCHRSIRRPHHKNARIRSTQSHCARRRMSAVSPVSLPMFAKVKHAFVNHRTQNAVVNVVISLTYVLFAFVSQLLGISHDLTNDTRAAHLLFQPPIESHRRTLPAPSVPIQRPNGFVILANSYAVPTTVCKTLNV